MEKRSPFGEKIKMDLKQSQSSNDEDRITCDFETQQARDQIVRSREQIFLTECFLTDILNELQKTKEQIQLCRGEVPEGLANGEASPPQIQPAEARNVGVLKQVYLTVEGELQMMRKELERAKNKHFFITSSKEAALKDYEAFSEARDAAMVKVKELTTELEDLTTEKENLAKAVAEVDELRLVPRVQILKVADMATQTAKDSEELSRTQLSLEQVKTAEVEHVAALGRVLQELDELKANLRKATEDGASLISALRSLQSEVAMRQSELRSAHETEQIACATLASLQDELCNIRALVMAAQASEAKARESKIKLPTAIKQLAAEADESKAVTKVNEELRKGRLELDQVKAAINTTVSWCQAALKGAEVAKASEVMALAEFKALSKLGVKVAAGSDNESKDTTTIIKLSMVEYHALTLAAEEAGNKNVAEATLHVEAAKASQQSAQEKLELVVKESEEAWKDLHLAQQKADDAQEAKLEIEAQLRKWRADEQVRKINSATPSSLSASAAQSPRINGKLVGQEGKSGPLSLLGRAGAGLESSTDVWSLKVPSLEIVVKTLPAIDSATKAEKAKKKSLVARIISLIVMRST